MVRGNEAHVLGNQAASTDANVQGVRRLNEAMSHEKRVSVTAIQTVGEQLRQPEVATLLAKLPPGQSHKIARPDLPVSDWRDLMNFGGRVRRSA